MPAIRRRAPQPAPAPIDVLEAALQRLVDAGYRVHSAAVVEGGEWHVAHFLGRSRGIARSIVEELAHPANRDAGRARVWVAGRYDRPALHVSAEVEWPEPLGDDEDGPLAWAEWGDVISVEAEIDWQMIDEAGRVIPAVPA